jgi:hypothetical protein
MLVWYKADLIIMLLKINLAPLWHIILIPSQPVFELTRSELQPTIYRTRGKHTNRYTTDAVFIQDISNVFKYLLHQ